MGSPLTPDPFPLEEEGEDFWMMGLRPIISFNLDFQRHVPNKEEMRKLGNDSALPHHMRI